MILNGATKTARGESDAILAELVDRFIDRFQAGEWVDARAFAAEHPEHAEALLELLPAAATMARLRRSLLQSEGHVRPFPPGLRHDRRLSDRPRDRPGWNGRGLRGRAGCDRPEGRPQGASDRCRDGPQADRAVPNRGAGGRGARSPAHRPGLRNRVRAGGSLLRHAIRRRVFARRRGP